MVDVVGDVGDGVGDVALSAMASDVGYAGVVGTDVGAAAGVAV